MPAGRPARRRAEREDRVPHDQRETPYLDAALRYRATGYTPFHTPGPQARQGRARRACASFSGDTLPAASTSPWPAAWRTRASPPHLIRLAEDYAAEAWGVRPLLVPRQRLHQRHPRPAAHAVRPRRHGDRAAQRPQVHARRAHLLRRHAAVHGAGDRPALGHPAQRARRGRAAALAAGPDAKAVFVTSPTYNGLGTDLAAHRRRRARAPACPFVTDQAWGPHLRFCPELPVDAMTAGADAAVVSTHKLISGITQSSVLMARAERINLARLDSMVAHDAEHQPAGAHVRQHRRRAPADGRRTAPSSGAAPSSSPTGRAREINELPGLRCLGEELLERGRRGLVRPHAAHDLRLRPRPQRLQLETVLRDDYRIAVEAADPLNIVLNVTFGDARADLETLVGALRDLRGPLRATRPAAAAQPRAPACSPTRRRSRARCSRRATPSSRAAVALPLAECAGAVSAEMVTPYPPGIPVLGPGEEISAEIVAYLQEASATGLKVHGPEDRTLRTLRVVGAEPHRSQDAAGGRHSPEESRVRAKTRGTSDRGGIVHRSAGTSRSAGRRRAGARPRRLQRAA